MKKGSMLPNSSNKGKGYVFSKSLKGIPFLSSPISMMAHSPRAINYNITGHNQA